MPSESRKPFITRSRALWGIAGLLVAVLVALVCAWFVEQSAVDSQLAALRAKGLPTTAKELNDFYAVPEGTADTTKLWINAIDAVQAANLRTRGGTLPYVGTSVARIPAPGEAWAKLEMARQFLGQLGTELQAIRRAAAAGGQVRFPVDFSAGNETLLPYTMQSREVARLLALNAHVCVHDGNGSQAIQDVRAIFALSDALRGEPTVMSQLVRNYVHAIGFDAAEWLMLHCEWTDAELESLQTAVQSARFKADMSNALCGERATCLITLNSIPLRPVLLSNVDEALRFFESSIEAYSGSWPDTLKRQRELDDRMKALSEGTITRLRLKPVLLVLPTFQRAALSSARAEAVQRCANLAIAAQRYRMQHGRIVGSLANIDQKFLGAPSEPSAQFTDPFDGQLLRLKLEPTRVVIYSIGENWQDDGGDCDSYGDHPRLDVGFVLKK